MSKILIVEDDRQLALYWQSELEKEGYEVIHETSVNGAIDALSSMTIDLVITDIVLETDDEELAHTGGLAVISYIVLHLEPRPRIIATSGFTSNSTFVDRNFKRMDSLKTLQKPLKIERLLHSVKTLLAHPTAILKTPDEINQQQFQREVQQRKQVEDKLDLAIHSNEALMELLETTAGVWDWRVGSNEVTFSSGYRDMLGFEGDDLAGLPNTLESFSERIHPDDREMAWAKFNLTLQHQHPLAHDYRLLTRDGDYIWVRSRAAASFTSTGEAIRMVGSMVDITAEKKTEQELQLALDQAALSTIVKNAPIEIYVFDSIDFNFLYVNQDALNNIGYKLEEIKRMSPLSLQPTLASDRFSEDLQNLKRDTNKKLVFESLHQRKNGSRYHVQTQIQLSSYHGNPCFIAIATDISRRIENEQALRRYRTAMDNSGDAVYMLDEFGQVVYVNDRATTQLGYSRDELLAMNLTEIDVDVASTDVFQKQIIPRLLENEHTLLHGTHRRKDGSQFPVEIAATMFVEGEQQIFVGNVRDISERVASEQALRAAKQQAEESEARFKRIANLAPAIIWLVDPQGDLQWASAELENYCGVQQADILVQGWQKLLHPDDTAKTYQRLQTALKDETMFESEYRLLGHDGQYRWFQGRGVPRYDTDANFNGLVGITINIHLSKSEHVKQLESLNRRLERSNSELEQFAYVASHDLRSPLRGISNIVGFLREDEDDNLSADSRKYLNEMERRAHQMEKLLDDLLAYSKVKLSPRDDATTIESSVIVQEAIDLLDRPEHIKIVLGPSLPKFRTDPAPLRQVFLNLISNAITYHDKETGRIEINAIDSGDFYLFQVVDDGPGIDPRYHKKVFQMFQRLHGREFNKGSGMGLALIQKIIRSLGGEIELRSELGQGCTFQFTWPKFMPDN